MLYRYLIRFNSTLVQLKAYISSQRKQMLQRFNSTLVQLKVRFFSNSSTEMFCFNSTLVQLKEAIRLRQAKILLQFQFYLSSIKRKRKDDFGITFQ